MRAAGRGTDGSTRVSLRTDFVIVSKDPDEPTEDAVEVTLTAEGGQTILVLEHRGVSDKLIAEYGAGDQIHVEDLGEYLAGRGRIDARARFEALIPAYRAMRETGGSYG